MATSDVDLVDTTAQAASTVDVGHLIEQESIHSALNVQPEALAPEVLIALAVVAVSLLVLLLYNLFSGSRKVSRKAVLVGPCNSGKTCLFFQLIGSEFPEGTVASMQENDGTCQILNEKERPVASARIVDIPGHERLRHKLDSHLKDAKAVVFVLDAVDITPHKVDAAEELFEVLTHPSIPRRRVPILLACNKMDLETQAHSVEFIERTLQKQLDAMRKTRIALSPESAAKAAVLGKGDKPLTLAGLRNSVTIASISAKEGNIADVHAFLRATM